MFKPKLSELNQNLSFKMCGIGKKNKELLIGLRNQRHASISDSTRSTIASGATAIVQA